LDALAIVVVTWRSATDVEPLLASLADALDAGAELVVVENASGDDTPALVRRRVPSATVVVNTVNRGFAAAANQGWRASRAPYVLFLNPDTVVEDGALASALRHLAADAAIGVLGCRTVGPDGSPQATVDRFHAVRDLIRQALRERRGAAAPARGSSPRETRDVDWLYGSFLMCRRDALTAVGGFDEAYEMYGEDIDLCDRMWAAGRRVVYFADATIVHRGNRSGAIRYGADRDLAVLKGTLRWFRRRRGRWHERAFRAAAGPSFAAKALIAAVGGSSPDRGRRYARMAWLCVRGDHGARLDAPPAARPVARPELS
jgi:GT2 family glycosyltransferase